MVTNKPTAMKGTRHLGQIHRTDRYQNTNSKPTDKPSGMEHPTESVKPPAQNQEVDLRKRVCTALKSASKHGEESSELDVHLATKVLARPHDEQ